MALDTRVRRAGYLTLGPLKQAQHNAGPCPASPQPQVQTLLGEQVVIQVRVYDAAYFELAQRKGVPLATLDDALRKAARAGKVPPLIGEDA